MRFRIVGHLFFLCKYFIDFFLLHFLDYFLDYFGFFFIGGVGWIFCDLWIFSFFLNLLRLLLKVTKVSS